MVKAIKFCYLISIPLFLAVLLYYYAMLPDQLSLYFEGESSVFNLSKGNFFYSAIGLFILTNGIIIIYRQLAQSQVDQSLIDFADMNRQESLYHWVQGLSLMFNVVYILSIIYIGLFHSKENFDITDYNILVYLGPIFIVLWIFWFFYLLATKK
ncbi:hypothetical protein [Reichenbachiella ulvae]|uniref:DUF1648 domain-containing protein n=1 Tax=Reichenbachiella ulvae TaxID=2980104 RepID=A0ABT3CS68_9BACT|nr:hypothetical protein [Reichenbachiella ulvae]MCV9386113.1 hypothetical protein [Reichenbachiella ulvae]